MKPAYIIVHYSEIGIKGKNRYLFEDLLRKNILSSCNFLKSVKKERGYFVCELSNPEADFSALENIPGVANFLIAAKCQLNLDGMLSCAKSLLSGISFETFKVDTKRHNKEFPLTSIEVSRKKGSEIVELSGGKVKMLSLIHI